MYAFVPIRDRVRRWPLDRPVLQNECIDDLAALHAARSEAFEFSRTVRQIHAELADHQSAAPGAGRARSHCFHCHRCCHGHLHSIELCPMFDQCMSNV